MPVAIRSVEDMTPHKFSCPHVVGRFSSNGLLLRVLPNSPKDGVAAHIELHDLKMLMAELPSALEMKFFPGLQFLPSFIPYCSPSVVISYL